MVLLWHHSEEPFSVTDGIFIRLCALTRQQQQQQQQQQKQ